MTLSIVGRCPRTGQLGVAAVTGTPGVGKLLTWAQPGVGAVATQAWINPYLGVDALSMLHNGHTAEKALEAVIGLDDDASLRQIGVLDAGGRSAAFTGSECADETEHSFGDDHSVQGNMLRSRDAVAAAAKAFRTDEDADLVDRLMSAIETGDAAGGDQRGAYSATVYVVEAEQYPLWDVRVDEHPEPLRELRRLKQRFAETLLPQIRKLPTRRNLTGNLRTDSDEGLV